MSKIIFLNCPEFSYGFAVLASEAETEEWRRQAEKSGFEYRSFSLRQAASPQPHPYEASIVEYLRNAPTYSAVGCVVSDVLDPQSTVTLFPGQKTDGFFVWPMELYYYVQKYHVRLPEEVVQHMKESCWIPPEENKIDWNRLKV